MKKVVDSNYLQCEKLRDYLAASPSNYAVLTDYAAMEAYKGDTLKSIYRSMEIVAGFPKQVIVLKSTTTVCGLSGRKAGLQRRLIDQKQTRDFAGYANDLRAAQAGDKAIQRSLLRHGAAATAQIARVEADAINSPELMAGVAKAYTPSQISLIRRKQPPTEEMLMKLVDDVFAIALMMFRNHPNVFKRPRYREALNMYIFRYSLCMYLWFLEWVSEGGQRTIRPDKLRNDVIDLSFAAYATFFDGLLSADRKVLRIHLTALSLLQQLAA